MKLDGQTVLVSGAAQGIGAAIARKCAALGARVSLGDIDTDLLAVTAREIAETGGEVFFTEADVTSEASTNAWVAKTVEHLGAPTGLVNNAGRNSYEDPLTMTTDQWSGFFDLDLRAAWLVTRSALPWMVEVKRGSIVTISSIHARLTAAGMFPYAAAKAGLIGLTKSLALELVSDGIRVNAISPGLVWTPLAEGYYRENPEEYDSTIAGLPMGRPGRAEEIASVAAFLLSDESSFVTGAEWPVDGGQSVALT